MRVVLSIPTGINHLYKQGKDWRTGGSRWYKDQKAVDWQNGAIWIIKKEFQQLKDLCNYEGFGNVIYINWYFKDKRRHDADSGLKLLLDTIVKAGVIEDDSQIIEIHIFKRKTTKENYCEVEIL